MADRHATSCAADVEEASRSLFIVSLFDDVIWFFEGEIRWRLNMCMPLRAEL